ncbi:MAG: D-alanyl-D-alanine carboxypeptidase family protein [Candidatus Nitrotoga sp.]|nr:D-alanyl-D-alanine carboxypeptidase family protein [Candidatus Nitrotoga sp.]MDO9447551.1 D-alanyl-D-alanine carboxypeptidase family protein [Candidatus Nitrotoga sp.]MDP3497635.1 D-alanyl-D-alanine carboxypeptidase family protein [Candidatus Nitrotoga sp.]
MKFSLLLFIALLSPLLAQAQLANLPPAPVLAAKSYLLYDFTSNQILVDQNGNERTEPASITKLMTAYLTFSSLKLNKFSLDQTITPSAEALRAQGVESRMFLDKNKPVTIAELLRGLIVQSGNDAARVLAITLAGSEENFAKLMNQEAQRLGMSNTHYINATGMPHPQHYSSAYDTAILAAAIVRDFPEHYPIYSLREYLYNNINQANRNRLLWMDPYVDGMKTGHTESAGFCLVASAKRNQRRLISVVLGTASDNLRATESQKLLNYGFQNFEAVRLYKKNEPVANLHLWKGTESKAKVGFRSDLFLSIPTGQMAQLKATMETQQPLIAPLSGGQKVGMIKISLGGKPYAEYKLVVLEPVPLANVFSRGWDSIRLLFK